MAEKRPLPASDVAADLAVLARARVFFGHQSVGGNLLDGLAALAKEQGVALRVVEAPAGVDDGAPAIVHQKVGRNAEPETKCEAFGSFLTGAGQAARFDAAVLKFCYADLGDRTDIQPAQLLAVYEKTVAAVRSARPDVTLVHATVPLSTRGEGKGDRVRAALGLETSKDANNARRGRFNDLLRTAYAGEPLFDVARAESTQADGSRAGSRQDGLFVDALRRDLSSDGGHLNDEGRRVAAREFARSLAAALRGRAPVPSS
ncbi:MAG: hypothetical protein ABW221_11835 [Vicinamibacteria bacterium]